MSSSSLHQPTLACATPERPQLFGDGEVRAFTQKRGPRRCLFGLGQKALRTCPCWLVGLGSCFEWLLHRASTCCHCGPAKHSAGDDVDCVRKAFADLQEAHGGIASDWGRVYPRPNAYPSSRPWNPENAGEEAIVHRRRHSLHGKAELWSLDQTE